MKKRDTRVLRILSRTEPSIAQAFARDALDIANALPDTIVDVPIERGVKNGLILPIREGVFKLVGSRGLERE